MSVLADYRCPACSAVSEHKVNQDEAATLPCPECGHSGLTRLIGAVRVMFSHMASDGSASSDALTSSIDRWQRDRERKMKTELRNLERHGTED